MNSKIKLIATIFVAVCAMNTPASAGFNSLRWGAGPNWTSTQHVSVTAGGKKKKAKRDSAGKVSFLDGSAESRGERDSRLKRECKGRPNAGACQGYTY
jgi:hypothetical protein